jgi:hypothetical protein
MDSGKMDQAIVRWEKQAKLSLMSEKEFEPEQDRHEGTRRITPRKLGQQRVGTSKVYGDCEVASHASIRPTSHDAPAQVVLIAGIGCQLRR